jgi:hypothetical protein
MNWISLALKRKEYSGNMDVLSSERQAKKYRHQAVLLV